ncbi:hypothetical protein OPV22_015266 [Ensete ventricosum]|uniref:Uncharacterized protein n=1 Tax=Ensete ventricosum TaxID=4639 RepID=A0AAV8R3G0_ENSVE|nr:hypothetical protein OPV22_015266 [Ensete ventricosum]
MAQDLECLNTSEAAVLDSVRAAELARVASSSIDLSSGSICPMAPASTGSAARKTMTESLRCVFKEFSMRELNGVTIQSP